MADPQTPNCTRCEHFFVTWEAAQPNGCHAYGFKSKDRPSVVVQRTSGSGCQSYSPKPQPTKNAESKRQP